MKNPFGDDAAMPERVSPFEDADGALDPIARIENAARKIRRLRSQMGAEGLTLAATRELIDELSGALDSAARVLRERETP